MQISTKDWKNYIDKLSKLNEKAASEMQKYVQMNGFADTEALIDFCHALVTKYGEGSAELACQMYDAIAEMSGAAVEAAMPAATATYAETARAVQGSLIQSPTGQKLAQVANRLVKQAAADTTMQNAIRDHAEWAWVPSGDTCGFCITLASNGWQRASQKVLKGGHASHIHANCNCMFAIRFGDKGDVKGYDPDYYKKLYDEAEGSSSSEKMKSLRRQLEDRDKINAQKRAAYLRKKNNTEVFSIYRTDLRDEYFPKSVGAKWQNYDIIDKRTNEIFHIAEGAKIQDKKVFAGYGTSKPLDEGVPEGLTEQHPGSEIEKWQHVKAKTYLDYYGEKRKAEIHWFQEEHVGKDVFKVKYWLD